MPIYEYRCTECDHRMEKLQRMSDDPLVECPNCDKPGLTKLVSASSFKLKGTGWYETDFKGSKKTDSGGRSSETKAADKSASSKIKKS